MMQVLQMSQKQCLKLPLLDGFSWWIVWKFSQLNGEVQIPIGTKAVNMKIPKFFAMHVTLKCINFILSQFISESSVRVLSDFVRLENLSFFTWWFKIEAISRFFAYKIGNTQNVELHEVHFLNRILLSFVNSSFSSLPPELKHIFFCGGYISLWVMFFYHGLKFKLSWKTRLRCMFDAIDFIDGRRINFSFSQVLQKAKGCSLRFIVSRKSVNPTFWW